MLVEDQSELILADEFTGSVFLTDGFLADTNVFGSVAAEYPADEESIAASAARFCRDDNNSIKGCAVSNDLGRVLLVWSTALDDEDAYVDKDGIRYVKLAAGEPSAKTVEPTAIAFKSIAYNPDTGKWALVITNAVKGCVYRLYASALPQAVVDVQSEDEATNLVAEADEELTFEIEGGAAQRYWRATAESGTIEE